MVASVKTCCGCYDLRTGCVAIAALRIVLVIITIFYLIYRLFFREEYKPNFNGNVYVDAFLLFVLCVIYILFSYWFIRGIYLKDPAKMKYYIILTGIDLIIIIMLQFGHIGLFGAIGALVEVYIFICSYSIYKEMSYEEGTNVNTAIRYEPAQPPLSQPYDSCDNTMKTSIPPTVQPTMQQQPEAYGKLYP